MADAVLRNPPLPVAQSFLTCHEVFRGQRRGATLVLGPVAHVPATQFPALIPLAVYAEFTGGHGSYLPGLCLRDPTEEVVWRWTANGPFTHSEPLLPSEVIFNELTLVVPTPGRYSLVLLLNGQEAAQRTLWFGPAERFRMAELV